MKILQVIPYFYPAWKFGGPVKVAYDISRKLVERGHSVTVYTSDIKDENSRIDRKIDEVDGIDICYLKNLSLLTTKIKMFITPSLISTLKKNITSFDIVHIHGFRTSQNPIFYYFLKKYSVPYVIQAHGGIPNINKNPIKRMYDELFGYKLLNDASKVIALSQTEALQYKSMGVLEEKIEIIPNGIDLSEYSDLPSKDSFKKKYNIPEDDKIVLYLGRIHKSKGLDLLADAFSVVLRDVVNVRLVLVGPNDGYATTFLKRILDLGIEEKVLLTGFVEKRDKLAALLNSEVFVTPSFYGFPLTFLEACATGTPIITTYLGDSLEWINGNVGYVTPPSHLELAKAIHAIFSDDELRKKFSRNCMNIVRSKFSLEKMVTQLEQVYKDVIRKQKI